MKIHVEDNSRNGIVFVRLISWKTRCEEQLSKINAEIKKIIKDLEGCIYE